MLKGIVIGIPERYCIRQLYVAVGIVENNRYCKNYRYCKVDKNNWYCN